MPQVIKDFNEYRRKFAFVWKHIEPDCRAVLISEFLFNKESLNARYEEWVKYQNHKDNWFKLNN